MDSDTKSLILVLLVFMAIMVIIIVLSSVHHVKKAKFKPKFVRLSDGSLQMEFNGFGGLQSARTERFLAEYKKGQEIEYQGKIYIIEEIREAAAPDLLRNDLKMVCYLVEKE